MDQVYEPGLRQSFWSQLGGWFRPWREVRRYPGPLVLWLVITLVAGSVGFWLTPLLGIDDWFNVVGLSSLGSFCIVMLVEAHQSILLSILLTGRPRELRGAESGRLIAIAIAAILLIIQAALVVAFRRDGADLLHLQRIQAGLTIAAVVTGAYLLCFRLRDLDPSASAHKSREDETVEELGREATTISETSRGEAL